MPHLWYDHTADRWAIAERELHCGDCFQVHNGGAWLNTRIEHSAAGWYLVDLNPSDPWAYEGRPARFHT